MTDDEVYRAIGQLDHPDGGPMTLAIVIPARNDRDHLERCLDSIAAQSVAPDEVIVVDNGDNGDTHELTERYGCRVVHEPVVGIPAATARGLDAASAEVIARVDADAVLPPDWVQTARELFADDEVEAVTGSGWLLGSPPLLARAVMDAYLGAYTAVAGVGLGHRPLWGSSTLLRRELWLVAREGFCRHDQRVHDDLDLSLHLPSGTRVVLDRRLSVGVSSRPFHDPAKLWRYVGMGVYTFVRHWPHELPPYRYVRIIRAWAARRRSAKPRHPLPGSPRPNRAAVSRTSLGTRA